MQISKVPQNRAEQIAVEEVTIFNDVVSIHYYLPEWDETKAFEVPAHKYEDFLTDINALDWSFQVMEGNVYKDDVEGTMNLAEYFAEVGIQDQNKDAVSYLKIYHVEREGLADIGAAVQNLKNQIDNYPLGYGQPASEFDVTNQVKK